MCVGLFCVSGSQASVLEAVCVCGPKPVALVSACVFTAGPAGPACADGQLSITPPSAPAEPGELRGS